MIAFPVSLTRRRKNEKTSLTSKVYFEKEKKRKTNALTSHLRIKTNLLSMYKDEKRSIEFVGIEIERRRKIIKNISIQRHKMKIEHPNRKITSNLKNE